MATSTLRIAHRFLAIGGRLMLNPVGDLVEGISMDALFGSNLTDRQRASAFRVNRAVSAFGVLRRDETRNLIQHHGQHTPSGWVVWAGR